MSAASLAVTITSWEAPGADGLARPVTTSWLTTPRFTVTLWNPVIDMFAVSFAVTLLGPGVFRVTAFVNVCTPASPATNE